MPAAVAKANLPGADGQGRNYAATVNGFDRYRALRGAIRMPCGASVSWCPPGKTATT